MIVYNSDYSTIHCLEGMDMLYTEWKESSSDLSEEELKTEMEQILQQVEEHQTKNIIADTSRFKYKATQKTQRWIGRFFMADIIEMGVKKYAIIVPKEVYPQFEGDNNEEELYEGFKVKYFMSKDQAMNWLISDDWKSLVIVPVITYSVFFK